MNIEKISLQIYTARNFKPYDNILKFLSEQGMKKVELFEVEAFPETKELLDKYEMSSPSSHIGFSTLENTKLLISNLKESNITTAIVPSPVGKPGGKFSSLFDKTEEEWNDIKQDIAVDFLQDTHFAELKNAELLRERLATLREVDEYVGRYYSVEWVRKNILMQTEEDIENIIKQIDDEGMNEPDPDLDV